MPDPFDPYLQWLAILPAEQPPNHYRLLALPLFVDSADVIESAADQRMAHVRTFGMGKHSDLSQKILNEISAAKVLLLDPKKKQAYDQQLRSERAQKKKRRVEGSSSKVQRPELKTRKVDASKATTNPVRSGIEITPRKTAAASRIAQRRKKSAGLLPAMMAVGALLLLAGIAAVVFTGGNKEQKLTADKTGPNNKKSRNEDGSNNKTSNRSPRKIVRTAPNTSNPFESSAPDFSDSKSKPDREETSPDDKHEKPSKPLAFTFEPTDSDSPTILGEGPGTKPADSPGGGVEPVVQSEPIKKPIPDEASLADKQALIAELYADQIKAARTKTAKGELAQLLLDAGRQTENDPVGKYALLDTAVKHAIESGRVELATDSVRALAKEFDVDSLKLNIDTLFSLARTVADNDQRTGIAQSAIEMAETAIQSDRFDEAEKLSKLVASAAGRLREPTLRKASNSLRTRLRLFRASWDASDKAIMVLEEQPDNADAHLARGKYLALLKRDWQEGLPHLAKGSDAALAKLAQQEAALPKTAEARLALASGWYEWASDAKDDAGLVRALHWYQNVLDDVPNLQAAHVNQRIDELIDKVRPLGSGVARLPWVRGPVGLIREFQGHKSPIAAFDLSADGRYALTGGPDKIMRIYDLSTGQQKQFDMPAYAYPAAFAPNSDHIISYDGPGTISVIHWKTEERKLSFKTPATPASIALLPNQPIALAVVKLSEVYGWNYTTGKQEFHFPVSGGTIKIAVTPDGRRVLLGQKEGRVAIHDLASGKLLHQLDPHLDAGEFYPSVAVSPDSRWGISVARIGPARLWDLRTGKLVSTLNTVAPAGAAFSPDGRRVALAGHENEVDVWQLKTNTRIHNFPTRQPMNAHVAFTPDGRGLVSADRVSGRVGFYRIADPQ